MPPGSPAPADPGPAAGQIDPTVASSGRLTSNVDRQPQQASPQVAQRRRAPYGRHRKLQRERQRPQAVAMPRTTSVVPCAGPSPR